MRKIEKYGKLIAMSAAALGMTAALTIESSLAYFTTYVSAGGGQVVNLGAQTTIHENLSDMTKHIVIKNDSPINDCFVRVKVFCGADVEITYTDEAGNWREGTDGYWYYEPVLPASPDPKKPSRSVLRQSTTRMANRRLTGRRSSREQERRLMSNEEG